MSFSILAIGSNLGNRKRNLNKAIDYLSGSPGIQVMKIAKFYKTAALTLKKGEKQPFYLNSAVKIRTTLSPVELLKCIKEIERRMGRRPSPKKWAPRKIDIDIITYGRRIIRQKGLQIPHPEAHKRPFVLKPLCDIDAKWRHPVLKISAGKLLKMLG